MPPNFVSGLATGLRDLPFAIEAGRERRDRLKERRKREAYTSELSSVFEDGEGPVDYGNAARIAARHGDLQRAGEYEELGDLRRQRGRENELADIGLGFEFEDRELAGQQRQSAAQLEQERMFVRRVSPHARAGDVDAINRLIAQNPGIVGTMAGLPSHRLVEGMEEAVDPQGQRHWALRIKNDRTQTTGPMTRNASPAGDDTVLSMTPEEFQRALSPWQDESEPAWTRLSDSTIFNKGSGESRQFDVPGKTQKPISVDGRIYDPNTQEFRTPDPRNSARLDQASEIINKSIPVPQGFDRQGMKDAAQRRSTALSFAQQFERYYGVPVESSAAAIASILQGKNEFSNALLGDDLEASNAAAAKLMKGLASRFGASKGARSTGLGAVERGP